MSTPETKDAPPKLFILSYQNNCGAVPAKFSHSGVVLRKAFFVNGRTFYVAQRPGDGGVGWGFETDRSKASLMTEADGDDFLREYGYTRTAKAEAQ